MPDTLPDGTDHILPGAMNASRAADSAPEGTAARDQLRAGAADLRARMEAAAEDLRSQASDRARDYAEQGKARMGEALDEVARLLGENAMHIDDRVGAQYGDYARRAADYVSDTAEALRGRDVDDLVEDLRALVRRSPSLAIGAAATTGFVLARVIKAGSETLQANAAAIAPQPIEDDVSKAARKAGKRKPAGEARS